VRKLICQNCGQEFTPKQGSDSKNLCPKCFIQKLNHVAANNSGNDPAANKTIMDQPNDSQQPKPTMPGTPPGAPVGQPTGEEPTPPEPVVETPTPEVPTPAPEGEEPAKEGGETPMGGETPPVPPVI